MIYRRSGSDEKTEKAKPISTKGLTAAEKAKIKQKKSVLHWLNVGIDPYNGWKANYQILPDKESGFRAKIVGKESRSYLSGNRLG